jgi:hypothetical protein
VKRFLLAFALLAMWGSAHAQLTYPGLVYKTTRPQDFVGTMSWHWQIGPGQWVLFASLAPTDVIATCSVFTANNNCQNGSTTHRLWKRVSDLTASTLVMQCSGNILSPFNSWQSCASDKTWYLTSGQELPASGGGGGTPPVDPPPTTPPTGCGAPVAGRHFTNITPCIMPFAKQVSFGFWAGAPDLDRDGIPELFFGAHETNTKSALYKQDANGIYQYVDPVEANYYQPTPTGLRISMRQMFGDYCANSNGMWSMLGHDADGLIPARFCMSSSVAEGGPIHFENKTAVTGFAGSFLPTSMDEDGSVWIAHIRKELGVEMRDIDTGLPILTLMPYSMVTYSSAVFDVDLDGIPEVVFPNSAMYLKYLDGILVPQMGKFLGDLPPWKCSSTRMDPGDFVNDLDYDLYIACTPYSGEGDDNIDTFKAPQGTHLVYFYRNDGGVFTNISLSTELVGKLSSVYYGSSYAPTFGADLELDGFLDMVYGLEARYHANQWQTTKRTFVPLIRNDKDFTFTVDRKMNFGDTGSANNLSTRPWVSPQDINGDGAPELIKNHGCSAYNLSNVCTHDTAGVFRNDMNTTGNKFLKVKVQGVGRNTMGLGATVIVRHQSSNAVITDRQIGNFTSSYQELDLILGVGQNDNVKVEVVMPNGLPVVTFNNVETNKSYQVTNSGQLVEE